MGNREWETGNGKPGMGNRETLEPWEPRKLPNPGKPGIPETLGNSGKFDNSRNWETDSGPELETSWTRLDLLDYMGASCPVCETVKRNTIPEAKDSGCPS